MKEINQFVRNFQADLAAKIIKNYKNKNILTALTSIWFDHFYLPVLINDFMAKLVLYLTVIYVREVPNYILIMYVIH